MAGGPKQSDTSSRDEGIVPTFVPTQVVEYLDAAFPGVKTGGTPEVGDMYRANVAMLLTMIDAIPSEVIILDGEGLVDFSEAVGALRIALESWTRGDRHYELREPAGSPRKHPLGVLRATLCDMPDEAIAVETDDLGFVADETLRRALRTDITTANTAYANREWKAATVIAGSVLEALLLDQLEPVAEEARARGAELARRDVLRRRPPRALDDWNLEQLIETARSLKILSDDAADQCSVARRFRNLIHPGRSRRLGQPCDLATTLSALAAVEHVIREFGGDAS